MTPVINPSTPDKHRFFILLLQECEVVSVHFAGLKEGVVMPPWLQKPTVTFEYGLNLPIPIPDITCDENGIHAVLAFSGKSMPTFVPYDSIYAITVSSTGRGIVWPSEMPEDLRTLQKIDPPKAKEKPNHLRLVK